MVYCIEIAQTGKSTKGVTCPLEDWSRAERKGLEMAPHILIYDSNDSYANTGIMHLEGREIVYINKAARRFYENGAPKRLEEAFDAKTCHAISRAIDKKRGINSMQARIDKAVVYLSADVYSGEAVIRISSFKPLSKWYGVDMDTFSKEVKNPLQILNMAIPSLAREKNEFVRNKLLASMMHNCYLLARTVNDMGEILMSDYTRFSPASIDLVAWLKEDAGVLNGLDFNCEVSVSFDTELKSLLLTADTDLIFRAVMHLISNAVRHGKADSIRISLASAGNKALITVSDNGRGITGDIETLMSDPASDTNGLGLGLQVVARIAQLHDGSLIVKINERGGLDAMFTISLHIQADTSLHANVPYESGADPYLIELCDILPDSAYMP